MVQSYIDRNVDVETQEGPSGKSKKTLKNETYVTNISQPNELYRFASYNTLFTLSALSQEDLFDTPTLLNSKPHDIIIKSGGIGPTANQSPTEELNADNKKTISENDRLQGAVDKSFDTLKRNRDLYFRSVTMNNIPGLNAQRRLTSVTQIQMEISEPSGITLLERIRAAALSNNFLDHLDAPYLLTLEFQGFDELGNPISQAQSQHTKRLIPIKLVDMQMQVNQAGTNYTVKAIPYNEFAYVNRYNYPRTSGTLNPTGKSLSYVALALEDLLNKQNEDEKKQGLVGEPDKYIISIHEDLKPEKRLEMKTLEQTGMASEGATGADGGWYVGSGEEIPADFMKITPNNSIIKILEELMKAHPDFSDDKFKEFKDRASTVLSTSQKRGGAQQVLEDSQDFYFNYFRIRSSVVPQKKFDKVRATNPKTITFTVEPYKVHAYSLSIPGVSTGQNFKDFVFKTYNYMFTGENVDILDLDINYRVAYFQSRLKDFQADNIRQNTIENINSKKTGSTTAQDHFVDGNLLHRQEPGSAKSEGAGVTGGTPTQLDAFLDSLTHPQADMVNLRMEILGDPAWLGQSQFIPAKPELFASGGRIHRDQDIDYWRGNKDRIWNDKLKCYNSDIAEPIVYVKFKMPADFSNNTGVYELRGDQSAEFSGLYRVVQVEHNFVDGKYTNVLQLTRFNNQGVKISSPFPTTYVTGKATGESQVVTLREFNQLQNNLNKKFSNVFADVTNIGRKFKELLKGFTGGA
jgi:hypothetical protein